MNRKNLKSVKSYKCTTLYLLQCLSLKEINLEMINVMLSKPIGNNNLIDNIIN